MGSGVRDDKREQQPRKDRFLKGSEKLCCLVYTNYYCTLACKTLLLTFLKILVYTRNGESKAWTAESFSKRMVQATGLSSSSRNPPTDPNLIEQIPEQSLFESLGPWSMKPMPLGYLSCGLLFQSPRRDGRRPLLLGNHLVPEDIQR